MKKDIREITLKKGIDFPSDNELVMMILGSGSSKCNVETLSKKVIKVIGQSEKKNLIQNLLAVPGMGTGKALQIASALELGRRRNSFRNAKIVHPDDILPFIKNYSMFPQEHFICVTLSGSHEIIKICVVSVGTLNKTIVHPREVFSVALEDSAAAIIVCHNHPSGDCNPSEDDIETTKKLIDASDILGIHLLDHIIFDKTNYFSFVEHNLLFN